MALDRETLFAALFERLREQLGTTCASYRRRMVAIDDLGPAECPALILVKGNEARQRAGRGLPILWTLTAECLVYVRDDGTNQAVPSTQINLVLQAIESALEIKPGELAAPGASYLVRPEAPPAGTTLGGLCVSCELGEHVEVLEGTQEHGAILMLPIEITAFA